MGNRRALVYQAGLVVVFMALAKLGAFLKDILLSMQFGAGQQTDAYFIANAIPGFVFGGVFATIGLVFLPAFKRASATSDHQASTVYRTAAIGYTGLSAVLGVLTFMGAPYIVSTVAPELPGATSELAVKMTRIVAFSFVFSGWVGLQTSVLQSHKRLIWPQLIQFLNHFFVICGLILAALMNWSITVLVYAAVIGWVVMALLISMRAAEYWPKLSGRGFDRHAALAMATLSFPVFLSLSLDQASILIGTYLGSSFPEGAISHLNYAQRLMTLLSSVFGLVIAYALFPYLTEYIVANKVAQARRCMALALIAVLLLSAPLLVISIVKSDAFISFVFQRGAFGPDDAMAAGPVLAYFAPVIVLAGVREVLNRLFLAWQQTGVLLFFGFIAMLTNVVSSLYFSRLVGLKGIALGATCGAFVYVAAQTVVVLARHRSLLHRDLPLWLGVIAQAVLVSAVTGYWLDLGGVGGNARFSFAAEALAVVLVFVVAVAGPALAFARLRVIFAMEQRA